MSSPPKKKQKTKHPNVLNNIESYFFKLKKLNVSKLVFPQTKNPCVPLQRYMCGLIKNENFEKCILNRSQIDKPYNCAYKNNLSIYNNTNYPNTVLIVECKYYNGTNSNTPSLRTLFNYLKNTASLNGYGLMVKTISHAFIIYKSYNTIKILFYATQNRKNNININTFEDLKNIIQNLHKPIIMSENHRNILKKEFCVYRRVKPTLFDWN